MKRVQSLFHSQQLTRYLQSQKLGAPVKFASVVAPERRPDGTFYTDAEGPSYAVYIGVEGHEMNLVFKSPAYRVAPDARWPQCFEFDRCVLVNEIKRVIELVGARNLLEESHA